MTRRLAPFASAREIAWAAAMDAAEGVVATAALMNTRGFMRSWVPISHGSNTTVTAASTYSLQMGLDSDYNLVRMVYSAWTNGYTISGACVSPTASPGLANDPVNAAGATDQTMWQFVYFNNAGLDVLPQDQATWGSGTRTFAVPAGSSTRPPRWYSDWVRVRSLDRIDGGVFPLILIRHLTDGTGLQQPPIIGTLSSWSASSGGRDLVARLHATFDGVTTPAALGTAGLTSIIIPDGVQYISSVPGITVLGFGDSLTAGFGSTTQQHGWGLLACQALSTLSRPITFWNQGWVGSTSDDFWYNGYLAYKGSRPDVVTIPAWTPNDAHTQAAAQLSWSRCMDFVQRVELDKRVPVVMGPMPYGTVTAGAQEAARQWVRSQMLAAASQGLLCIDWDTVPGLCTGADPNQLLPGLIAGAGQANHPNDAGNQIMDRLGFRPVLSRILGG